MYILFAEWQTICYCFVALHWKKVIDGKSVFWGGNHVTLRWSGQVLALRCGDLDSMVAESLRSRLSRSIGQSSAGRRGHSWPTPAARSVTWPFELSRSRYKKLRPKAKGLSFLSSGGRHD